MIFPAACLISTRALSGESSDGSQKDAGLTAGRKSEVFIIFKEHH